MPLDFRLHHRQWNSHMICHNAHIHLDILQSVFFILVKGLQVKRSQILVDLLPCVHLPGVVGGDCGTDQSLAQHLVAQSQALGVVGGRKDAALCLVFVSTCRPNECSGIFAAIPSSGRALVTLAPTLWLFSTSAARFEALHSLHTTLKMESTIYG